MPLKRINPPELADFKAFSQIVIGSGSRIVFISGQVAVDTDGQLVGTGDLAVQARQAFRNLLAALKAVGATPAHIAKITWYVVNYSEEVVAMLRDIRREAFGDYLPASTLVGVQVLARREYLIEVEAIAVLD